MNLHIFLLAVSGSAFVVVLVILSLVTGLATWVTLLISRIRGDEPYEVDALRMSRSAESPLMKAA
jgi:hypothetical protein